MIDDPESFKVVAVSNFSDESVSDSIQKDGLTETDADALCEKLRGQTHEHSRYWFVVRKSSEVDYVFEP